MPIFGAFILIPNLQGTIKMINTISQILKLTITLFSFLSENKSGMDVKDYRLR